MNRRRAYHIWPARNRLSSILVDIVANCFLVQAVLLLLCGVVTVLRVQEIFNSVRLTVQVKTRSPNMNITVEPDGTIVLHVTAPPTEGRANREVVRCLAKKFGKPSSQVRLVAGLHSKTKVIEILDASQGEIAKVLGVDFRQLNWAGKV